MAQHDNINESSLNQGTIVTGGDLGSAQRTIGGLLWQFETAELEKEDAVKILNSVGIPDHAYGDPGFPVSLQQDYEILNEVRKYLRSEVSLEVRLFQAMHFTRAHMFGALGMAWQSAPTILDALNVTINYPQTNWGRSRMIVASSDTEDSVTYQLDMLPTTFGSPKDVEETYKYALLLDITSAVATLLDIVSDRSLLKKVRLPFKRPDDWSLVARTFRFAIEFEAPEASIICEPGFFHHVPKRSYPLSFKLALKLVEKEAALLEEDATLTDQVTRWLWASTPPLKKVEIAKLLGLSERSLTRQLAKEGANYNQLFTEVQSERAENLLANHKLTVSEVAYRMGYTDPAAFTRAFTGWKGVTPSKWRSLD
ncbi:AraC family transcriptional regulator [Maricurvus nonylphenolicus]|uniref:AraC family transcriptional regulator n=1 Tax=Maricurvus nonylphenolicus TaxID=1008307 RepID=UPI0036F33508